MPRQADALLHQVGQWLGVHGEAVYAASDRVERLGNVMDPNGGRGWGVFLRFATPPGVCKPGEMPAFPQVLVQDGVVS